MLSLLLQKGAKALAMGAWACCSTSSAACSCAAHTVGLRDKGVVRSTQPLVF